MERRQKRRRRVSEVLMDEELSPLCRTKKAARVQGSAAGEVGRRRREVFRGKGAKPGAPTPSFPSAPLSSVSQQGSSSVFTSSPANESVFPTIDTKPLSLSGRRRSDQRFLVSLTPLSGERLQPSWQFGRQTKHPGYLTVLSLFWCNFLDAGKLVNILKVTTCIIFLSLCIANITSIIIIMD